MPTVVPLNDYVLVELIEKHAKSGLKEAGQDEFASIQKGTVIDVGEALYRSKGNWVLDEVQQAQIFNTLESRKEFLDQLTLAKKMMIGNVIYWEMYADKDTTFELEPGKKHALIKLAQICAMELPDDDGGDEAKKTAPEQIEPNGATATPQPETVKPKEQK